MQSNFYLNPKIDYYDPCTIIYSLLLEEKLGEFFLMSIEYEWNLKLLQLMITNLYELFSFRKKIVFFISLSKYNLLFCSNNPDELWGIWRLRDQSVIAWIDLK